MWPFGGFRPRSGDKWGTDGGIELAHSVDGIY